MKTCSVPGCERKHAARGYCDKHHYRFLKHGDPNVTGWEAHGMTNSREYRIRRNMLARCRNPNFPCYPRYGGRGITVCQEWQDSFSAFLRDMGPCPSPIHQIDRIDNDGPYCKENCRWVTPTENMHNTSKTKLSMTVARFIRTATGRTGNELAKEFGVSRTVVNAIRRGEIWKETDEISATAPAPDRLPPESSCPTPLQL